MPSVVELGRAARAGSTARRAASARPRARSRCRTARARRASRPCRGSRSRRGRARPTPVAHRLQVLVVGDARRAVAERQAASSRSTPVGSPRSSRSTTPPGDLEVAVRARERRRVEPQRVVVARHQRDRHAARDRVEHLPVGSTSAPSRRSASRGRAASRPARARGAPPTRSSASSIVARALEPHLALRERPGREVHVRVGEAREHAAAAQVDALGRWRARSRACRRRRRPARRRSRARARSGSDGSIVRTMPFSRITVRAESIAIRRPGSPR